MYGSSKRVHYFYFTVIPSQVFLLQTTEECYYSLYFRIFLKKIFLQKRYLRHNFPTKFCKFSNNANIEQKLKK